MRTTLSMHHIARIEGHGNISLSIEDGRVSDVKMNVVEPARLFESMVGGRPFTQTSYIASRICGICSSSHVITDLLAIEQIFGVKTSERTHRLAFTTSPLSRAAGTTGTSIMPQRVAGRSLSAWQAGATIRNGAKRRRSCIRAMW